MIKKERKKLNEEYVYAFIVVVISIVVASLFIYSYYRSRVVPSAIAIPEDTIVVKNDDKDHISYLEELVFDGQTITASGWAVALDETVIANTENGEIDGYINVSFLLKDKESSYYKLTTIPETRKEITEIMSTGHNFENRGFRAKASAKYLPKGIYQGCLLLTLSNGEKYLFVYDKTITI